MQHSSPQMTVILGARKGLALWQSAVAWHNDRDQEKIPTAKKRAKKAKIRRTDAQKCIRTDAQPRGSG